MWIVKVILLLLLLSGQFNTDLLGYRIMPGWNAFVVHHPSGESGEEEKTRLMAVRKEWYFKLHVFYEYIFI